MSIQYKSKALNYNCNLIISRLIVISFFIIKAGDLSLEPNPYHLANMRRHRQPLGKGKSPQGRNL